MSSLSRLWFATPAPTFCHLPLPAEVREMMDGDDYVVADARTFAARLFPWFAIGSGDGLPAVGVLVSVIAATPEFVGFAWRPINRRQPEQQTIKTTERPAAACPQ